MTAGEEREEEVEAAAEKPGPGALRAECGVGIASEPGGISECGIQQRPKSRVFYKWPLLVLLPVVLLVFDWLPYYRMLGVRRDLMEHATPGTPVEDYKKWVGKYYPTVDLEQESDGGLIVWLHRAGAPYSYLLGVGLLNVLHLASEAHQWVHPVERSYFFAVDVDTSRSITRTSPRR